MAIGTGGLGTGTGSPQTPWATNIDGGNFALADTSKIIINDIIGNWDGTSKLQVNGNGYFIGSLYVDSTQALAYNAYFPFAVNGNANIQGLINFKQKATPSAGSYPAASNNYLYFKSDGKLYSMNDSGTETLIAASGSFVPYTGASSTVDLGTNVIKGQLITIGGTTLNYTLGDPGLGAGYFSLADATEQLALADGTYVINAKGQMLWHPMAQPTGTTEGQIYFDSTNHYPYYYNGSVWKPMDGTGVYVPYTGATADFDLGVNNFKIQDYLGNYIEIGGAYNAGITVYYIGTGAQVSLSAGDNQIGGTFLYNPGGGIPNALYAGSLDYAMKTTGPSFSLGDFTVVDGNTLGSEMVTNGTFTGSATDWTLGTGWAYTTNKVEKNAAGTGTLSQASGSMVTPPSIGSWYVFSYKLSVSVGAGPLVTAGGTTIPYGSQDPFTGIKTSLPFQAVSTAGIVFTPFSTTDRFTIDTVSLKQAIGGTLGVGKSLNLAPISVPSSPIKGEIYFDSTSNSPYFYNGSSWVQMTGAGTNYWSRAGTVLSTSTSNDSVTLGGTSQTTYLSVNTAVTTGSLNINQSSNGYAVNAIGESYFSNSPYFADLTNAITGYAGQFLCNTDLVRLCNGTYAIDESGDMKFGGIIHDQSDKESLDVPNRTFYGNTGLATFEWGRYGAGSLHGIGDTNHYLAISVSGRTLHDSTVTSSINWNSRYLNNVNGTTVVDWSVLDVVSITGDVILGSTYGQILHSNSTQQIFVCGGADYQHGASSTYYGGSHATYPWMMFNSVGNQNANTFVVQSFDGATTYVPLLSINGSTKLVTFAGAITGTILTHTGMIEKVTAVTSTYTVISSDDFITMTGTNTVNLPTAVGISGTVYTIKNIDVAVVTVDANGSETIDGDLTYVIRTKFGGLTVISNGSNWLIKGVF